MGGRFIETSSKDLEQGCQLSNRCRAGEYWGFSKRVVNEMEKSLPENDASTFNVTSVLNRLFIKEYMK